MKETIFELEDEVEQHRAVKLHDNLLLTDLGSKWLLHLPWDLHGYFSGEDGGGRGGEVLTTTHSFP